MRYTWWVFYVLVTYMHIQYIYIFKRIAYIAWVIHMSEWYIAWYMYISETSCLICQDHKSKRLPATQHRIFSRYTYTRTHLRLRCTYHMHYTCMYIRADECRSGKLLYRSRWLGHKGVRSWYMHIYIYIHTHTNYSWSMSNCVTIHEAHMKWYDKSMYVCIYVYLS